MLQEKLKKKHSELANEKKMSKAIEENHDKKTFM